MNIVINKSRRFAAVTGASLLAVVLAACGSSASSPSGGGGGGGVDIVASTNVWGDIASAIAGRSDPSVHITSIISNPDQDPHSYEASAATALELSKADLVIENGGGYDDFVDTMLKAHAKSDVTVLNAVTISGKKASAGNDLNEHVWYDFPTVVKVADRIIARLSSIDPSRAKTFSANGAAFVAQVHGLERTEATIKAEYHGKGAAITEPVPLYMLQACGLVDRTPAKFSEAIENGDGVSVRVLHETLALFTAKQVAVLAYNEQTTGQETTEVLNAARSNGIPVVPVTETLPRGKTYLQWMSGNLSAVSTALAA